VRFFQRRNANAQSLRCRGLSRCQRARRSEIRQGIKEYANWPTIPQLYVNGEFVGGCDIMREMYQTGELQQLLAQQTA
jgi:glutaredoxin-related protein